MIRVALALIDDPDDPTVPAVLRAYATIEGTPQTLRDAGIVTWSRFIVPALAQLAQTDAAQEMAPAEET